MACRDGTCVLLRQVLVLTLCRGRCGIRMDRHGPSVLGKIRATASRRAYRGGLQRGRVLTLRVCRRGAGALNGHGHGNRNGSVWIVVPGRVCGGRRISSLQDGTGRIRKGVAWAWERVGGARSAR